MMYRLLAGLGTALILAAHAHAGSARSLAIVVSRDQQSLAVYDGDQVVATSRVSTGKPGHATPTGIFTIIEKQKYHESNLYSSAPMPFMQRITWSGVALHESSSVPRRPASHGCVRLPHAFARQLYKMTEMGVPVVIADEPLMPAQVVHPMLFRPQNPAENGTLLTDAKLRLAPLSDFLQETEVALNDVPEQASIEPQKLSSPRDRKGLRILITRRGVGEDVRDIQTMLNSLGFSAGEPDGKLGRGTIAAINAFKLTKDLPVKGDLLSEGTIEAIYKAAGRGKPMGGHVFVRRDFKPVFDASFELINPEVALGTHFLQLRSMDQAVGLADWFGLTVPDGMSSATRKKLGIVSDAPPLAEVMDRIRLPQDVRSRIEAELTEGSTITITDGGLGRETGDQGTDFITLTHPALNDG